MKTEDMSDEFFMKHVKYGLVAIKVEGDVATVVHFVGYINKPSQDVFDDCFRELNEDKSFCTYGKMGTEYHLVEATEDIMKELLGEQTP